MSPPASASPPCSSRSLPPARNGKRYVPVAPHRLRQSNWLTDPPPQLVVVLGALSQKRPSIALGNVLGSCISNVLGAFSLGLIFYERGSTIEFDRSARIYSLVLLALTTVVIPVLHHPTPIVWLVFGPVLIAAFGVYFFVAATAIVQGILTAPEDSDSDSDSSSMYIRDDSDSSDESGDDNAEPSEATALLPRRRAHSLGYHAAYLLFGFSAICLAGYVLSQAAIHIVDALEISDVLFSVIVLALATTLPEKFIAVLSGRLGQPGILVANCAGSNIFLLSLCCGVVMTSSKGELNGGNVAVFELAALWVSTAGFAATVWFGARYARWVGGVMVVAYLVFIVLEFTVVHKSHASMKAVTG